MLFPLYTVHFGTRGFYTVEYSTNAWGEFGGGSGKDVLVKTWMNTD